jgi:hypothetical protein
VPKTGQMFPPFPTFIVFQKNVVYIRTATCQHFLTIGSLVCQPMWWLENNVAVVALVAGKM